jgi:hypothetical protein
MTTIIYGGRACGKTTALVKEAAATGAYIVCLTLQQVGNILRCARNLNLHILYPITADEFISGNFNTHMKTPFLIDNVEDIIMRLARGCNVNTMTTCLPVEKISIDHLKEG